jgi:hypothetical protein
MSVVGNKRHVFCSFSLIIDVCIVFHICEFYYYYYYYYYHHHHHHHHIITISFMQGIYTYIPKTNHVAKE